MAKLRYYRNFEVIVFALLYAISNNLTVIASPAMDAYQEGIKLLKQGQDKDSFADFYKSIAEFDKAINLDPKFAQAYNARGSANSEVGSFGKAADDYSRAINLGRVDSTTYYYRGCAYSRLGKWQKAIDDYTKVIVDIPKNPDAYQDRAEAYRALGKTDLAEEDRKMAKLLGYKPKKVKLICH